MQENKFRFWQKWLVTVNLLLIIVSLLVAFAGNSFIFALHNLGTREVFLSGQDFSPAVLNLKNFFFAIIGGTMAGFHLLMFYIARYPFGKKEKWAFDSLLYSLLLWFLIDSGLSAYYGAFHNIFLVNLVALVIIGLPLAATRKEFK